MLPHDFVNEVTFSRNEPQHARLPTKRVSGATQFTQLARFSSHYWPANSLRLFSPFSPRKLLADTGPDIDRARDSDTKFCGRVARNCNKGRMLKFRSETDGFAFRTSPRLTMTMFLEIVECFDPDTKSIGYEVMF